MKYAIINDETQVIDGVILWDGKSEFTPPSGTSLVNVEDIFCGPGWVRKPDGSFEPAAEISSAE